MIGTIGQMIKDMEHGVYDFTKDGKCSSCGSCCSNCLPLSSKELKEIKRYVMTDEPLPKMERVEE